VLAARADALRAFGIWEGGGAPSGRDEYLWDAGMLILTYVAALPSVAIKIGGGTVECSFGVSSRRL